MPRLEYDLPLGRPAISPTNVVLQLRWERMAPPSIWKDGIEQAERINELLLRRQREEWQRTHGL